MLVPAAESDKIVASENLFRTVSMSRSDEKIYLSYIRVRNDEIKASNAKSVFCCCIPRLLRRKLPNCSYSAIAPNLGEATRNDGGVWEYNYKSS